ncbi:uncharacterized protein LOC6494337 isoform X2 [Drosophila ananassae]|uniref:uncharacterized protein LOC6494337 isoform X2 n=1 Tax=Drosophila ananassae TaxID=7217 RepID=UPI0013A5E695|nr:uncharacterized protein LOC6494337 isoform X2 [Drosophila ananassae]
MALNKRLSSQADGADFKFACRCCLKMNTEFLKLDSVTVARSLDPAEAKDKIPLLRCLLYCTRGENPAELPQYICIECSQSLQVAYYFLQNAVRAHDILCRKLCPNKVIKTRVNGSLGQELEQHLESDTERTKPLKTMRHECQVCGVIVYNRLELKQHIRLHADGLAYHCKMCSYTTLKQRLLHDHYRSTHNQTPAQAEELSKVKLEPIKKEDEVKVCTMEDMELLIPTVLTPEDYSAVPIDADQLRDIEQQLAATMGEAAPGVDTLTSTLPPMDTQNVSIGTEYLVLPDGSLQQVNGGGVVIEYIDDSKPANSNPHPPSININLQNLLGGDENEGMDIDVNELIVEDVLPQIKDLPKFFCDQCEYYSLRSADLIQHYQSQHHRPEGVAEKPDGIKQEVRTYSCDMCLFETRTVNELRVHYAQSHTVQPTDVELRPSWTADSSQNAKTDDPSMEEKPPTLPPLTSSSENHVPIKCPPAVADTQGQFQQLPVEATTSVAQTEVINAVVDATPHFFAATSNSIDAVHAPPVTEVAGTTGGSFEIFPEISQGDLTAQESVPQAPANTSNQNISMFGDMQDFIDNTDVAAICTIPADDMPVVDGDDIVIDNNNISLDFDAENLFEDFDEDEEVAAEEEDDEGENEDENENNDAATDQNLLLTSDDDDVDDFDDEQSKHLQKPYCIYCNKKFTSQYKFENHMFVHRGLAPYRCELCTNLYNMKRLLIRHYKTVHKRMPTRDMVQAKGDKVTMARTSLEKIETNLNKNPMLMCAKCPFECEPDGEMRKHLNAHHGINDGVSVHANEVFIIRKLPFECPRCIRSFAAKSTLVRHLQRSHLVETIIEMPSAHATASSAATTTTTTATATTSGPASSTQDEDKPDLKMTVSSTAAESGGGDGNGECEGTGRDDGDVAGEGASMKAELTQPKEEIDVVSLETSALPSAGISTASSAHPGTIVTTSTSTITTVASSTSSTFSTMIPTPTPFDLDCDLISDVPAEQSSSTPNTHSNPSTLLNGTDKFLSTSPHEEKYTPSNSRLPRTPSYKCKLCSETFDELGKLVKHEMVHSSTESNRYGYQHKCAICSTSYRNLTLLKFHMKRHTNRKIQCKLCPKSFATNQELDRHSKAKHMRQKTFRCTLNNCNKTFAYKHHMVRHQNATHLQTRHVCHICDKEMMTSLHLRNHMSVHKSGTLYKCPHCDRTYLRRGRICSHILKVHKIHVTDEELAVIFRGNVNSNNSHDLKSMSCQGQLVRRKDLEIKTEVKDEPGLQTSTEDIS